MNGLFSKKLFAEGMRQMRVLGNICLIVAALASFFIVNGMNISAKSSYEYASTRQTFRAVQMQDYIMDVGIEPCYLIMIGAWVIVPFAMLMLFGFLNKRNASDFYHGIVQKRSALCNSFLAAIFAWFVLVSAVIVLVTTVTSTALPMVQLEKYFWTDLLQLCVASIAIAVFWMGVLLLSMSLTGTVLTNVAVAAIILFFPKILYMAVSAVVFDDMPIYPSNYENSIFSGRYNLVTGFINDIFYYDNISYGEYKSSLYTGILGIIFIVIGCIAFSKRKSETATLAAPSRRMQAVFRTIPAFVATMMPVAYFFTCTLPNGETMDEEDIFYVIIFYVISLVVYFLYEIITTKKWRNIARIIPGYILVLVMDVLLFGAMFATRESVLSVKPMNSNSVSVIGDMDWRNRDYFEARLGEVKINDSRLITIFEECLKDNIEAIREGNDHNIYYNNKSYLVKFTKGNKEIYRNVYVPEHYESQIMNILLANVNRQALAELPTLKRSYANFDGFEDMNLSEEMISQLLEQYVEELLNSDESYITDIFFSQYHSRKHTSVAEISMGVIYKGKTYYVDLPIFSTTKFAQDYMILRNKILCGNVNLIEEYLNQAKLIENGAKDDWCRLNIVEYTFNRAAYNNLGIDNLYFYSEDFRNINQKDRRIFENAAQMFGTPSNDEAMSDAGYFEVALYGSYGTQQRLVAIYPITPATLEAFNQLQQISGEK